MKRKMKILKKVKDFFFLSSQLELKEMSFQLLLEKIKQVKCLTY